MDDRIVLRPCYRQGTPITLKGGKSRKIGMVDAAVCFLTNSTEQNDRYHYQFCPLPEGKMEKSKDLEYPARVYPYQQGPRLRGRPNFHKRFLHSQKIDNILVSPPFIYTGPQGPKRAEMLPGGKD